jgi:menaquinone-dependent protoporphyrinogen IX oxidase
MRVGIVFFPEKQRDKLLNISKGLAQGIEAQGHHADIIDGQRDVNTKLTIYSYIVIGTVATNAIGGKIPDAVSSFLSNAGMVTGKRCLAFIINSGLRTTKTLKALMSAMEHEGMYLKNSEIIGSPAEAEEIGKKLHIGT